MAGELRHRTPHFYLHQHQSNSTTFAAQIKCHRKTLDRFKGRKYGEEIMRDRKNEPSAERL